jgi:hypothetical protein
VSMEGKIYAIVSIRMGAKYIGSTYDFKGRRRSHETRLQRGAHPCWRLQEAWYREGSDGFSWMVLERVFDLKQLTSREQYWIDKEKPEYNDDPLAKRAGITLEIAVPLWLQRMPPCEACSQGSMAFGKDDKGIFEWKCSRCNARKLVNIRKLFTWVDACDGRHGVWVRRRKGIPY